MQVKVLVGVDVIERQPGPAIGLELRLDLGRDLPAQARAKEDRRPVGSGVAAEPAAGVDEVRHGTGRQHGLRLDEGKMQADPEPGKAPGPSDGVLGGGPADHQAGGAEHPFAMRLLDRLVDLGRKPEIIGRDDEVFKQSVPLTPLPLSTRERGGTSMAMAHVLPPLRHRLLPSPLWRGGGR